MSSEAHGRAEQSAARSSITLALRGKPTSAFERQLVELLQHEIFRRVDDLSSSEYCALVYQRLRYLHQHLDLSFETLLADIDRLLDLHYWVSQVDGTLTTLLTIHFNLCIGSILQLGNGNPTQRALLAELDRLDCVGVFLATELAYGNNVQGLETRATYDQQAREFVIDTPSAAAQKFMPNTGADGIAKLAVVLARLFVAERDCGVFPFLVRIRTEHGLCPGVNVTLLGDKPDYPLDNAITSFDDVRIPFEHWLAGSGSQISEAGVFSSEIRSRGRRFLQAMERVQTGKVCLAGAAVGMLSAAVALTLQYAAKRHTFGVGRASVPVLSYRTYQEAIFEAVASSYACAFLLQHVTGRYRDRTEHNDAEVMREVALVKAFTSAQALAMISRCRERLGAQGLFCANRVVTYWIGVNGIVTAEGDNEVLLVRAGRELLSNSDRPLDTDDALGGIALLGSPDYLRSLVRARETSLRERVLVRMRAERGQRTQFEMWNDSICDTVSLARTHAVGLALSCFVQKLDVTEDVNAREVLDRILRMFALQEIAQFSSELVSAGLMPSALAGEIAQERRRLCEELANDTSLLTDAYDIPKGLLDAPIGGPYIETYDRRGETEMPRNSFFRTLAPPASEVLSLRPAARKRVS